MKPGGAAMPARLSFTLLFVIKHPENNAYDQQNA
jgi:hypothetical protein